MDKSIVTSIKPAPAGLDDRRKIELENGDVLFIRRPSAESIRQSDWMYSKIYNDAFLSGVMTASQMMEQMKKREIISDAYEKEMASSREKLATSLFALANVKTLEEKEQKAIDVAVAREEILILNHRINGPLSNTCEQLAEDAKLDYLTSCMIETPEGKRVWANYDAYCAEPNMEKAFKSRLEVMLFLRNVESDYLETTPEQLALKEVREERTKQLTDLVEKKAAEFEQKRQEAINDGKVAEQLEEELKAEEAASENTEAAEEVKPKKKSTVKKK